MNKGEHWTRILACYGYVAEEEYNDVSIADKNNKNNPRLSIILNATKERCQEITEFLNKGTFPAWLKDIKRYADDHTFIVPGENKSYITALGPFIPPDRIQKPEDDDLRRKLIDRFFIPEVENPNKNKIIIRGREMLEKSIYCFKCKKQCVYGYNGLDIFDVYVKCPYCKAETRL